MTDRGGSIQPPRELRSRNGRLRLSLWLRSSIDSAGLTQYCYVDDHGDRSPTLRVRPGDQVSLRFRNEISFPGQQHLKNQTPNCTSSAMVPDATNLHFHGLAIPPECHADDSLRTTILPSTKTFVYRFRVPANQPPGLYWYHPHPHGHSEEQVLGGASGALIVEGIASANSVVAGLPERVLVIRDQKLSPSPMMSIRDPNRPAKDLSINFIPVPYPDYPVPVISVRPLTREFWRVLNASADTYLNLGVLFNGEWQKSGLVVSHGGWQPLNVVALDGVPISRGNTVAEKINSKTEIAIPPGGRAEFIFETPPEGVQAELLTGGVDTTPPQDEDNPTPAGVSDPDLDDNTPPRPLLRIVSSASATEPPVVIENQSVGQRSQLPALAAATPTRQRKLYFSEKAMDPKHPQTSSVFYITEEGHAPKAFDPASFAPDILVHQGDIEDWTIENRSLESHAFHIHQLHFLLVERDGEPVEENYLLDTVDVPYWNGVSEQFPSVKVRMDFRDPNIIGTFPYHCHILQHADAGMMGIIRVLPKPGERSP